jgi:hypothetical protein
MWFILGMMFLIMFGLKLAGIATISWAVVTAPLWAPMLIASVVFLFVFILTVIKGK